MDSNSIHESYTSEIVHLPNNDMYMFTNRSYADITRDFVSTARQYINDEYADSLQRYLNILMITDNDCCDDCPYMDELEELRASVDSSAEETEAERDELLTVIDDINIVLKKYKKKFDNKLRLSRLDIDPLLKQLQDIVQEYE